MRLMVHLKSVSEVDELESQILKSKLAKIAPNKFLDFAIKKSLKQLQKAQTKAEIKTLFDEAGGWGRGLILNITDVGQYHLNCNGNMTFYWLKDKPLVPFPKKVEDVEERTEIQKTGSFANCELILPYNVFLMMLGKEIGPMNATKKRLAIVEDYDGSGSLYHGTVLMKFFESLRSGVGL